MTDYLAAQKIIMNEAYEIPFHVNEDLLTFSSKSAASSTKAAAMTSSTRRTRAGAPM